MDRFLDENPGHYKPVTLPHDVDMGVGGVLKLYYHHLIQTETGHVEVEGKSYDVEPEVVAMLKSILFAGVCRIQERASACREVFLHTLHSTNKQEFLSSLELDSTNYYTIAINKAIQEVWSA